MSELIRIFLKIVAQVGPYFAVFVIFGYLARTRERKAKEREEEQKKGIIRTCYVVKTEKILAIIFIIGILFTGVCAVVSIIQKEDLLVRVGFCIAFIAFLIGTWNMIMWKVEVNGDEITWRSTFGKEKTFRFEDITYCERKKSSIRVYVNGNKLFTIDSGIDDSEFMDDIKRRKIPIKSYYANQLRKKK